MRPVLDRSPLLLAQGYRFLPRRFRRARSEVLTIRMLGEPVTCLTGPAAVRFFYDEARFTRAGVVPEPVRATLMGHSGVQTLDRAAHRHRRAMFLDLLGPEAVSDLTERVTGNWRRAQTRWPDRDRVVVFDEAARVLTAAACDWAGLPTSRPGVAALARDLTATVDGFATAGPRHWRARRARHRLEAWAGRHIRAHREGSAPAPEGSPLAVVAGHRDRAGRPLPETTAAVELLNLVRPTVAVAWYVTAGAAAAHRHPQWRARIRAGDIEALTQFTQEVRRWHPFTPLLGARARRDLAWRGHHVPAGRLVLLDVYGILHDPRWWPEPERFDPARFADGPVDPDTFIPQGGGDPVVGHRCPGEAATVALLEASLRELSQLDYRLPRQDLRTPLGKVPTRPRDGFVLADVRLAPVRSTAPGGR